MTARLRRLAATSVALAAIGLTSPVRADQDPPTPVVSSPAPAATPLSLRPAKAIELAPERGGGRAAWKVVAVLAALGGAAYTLRKRLPARRSAPAALTIVSRAAVGIRSELLVVRVEGQRLLLGVTPHTIQSLAVLDGDEAADPTLAREAAAEPTPAPRALSAPAVPPSTPSLEQRFAAVLHAARARHEPAAVAVAAPSDDPQLARQARGLLALRRRG